MTSVNKNYFQTILVFFYKFVFLANTRVFGHFAGLDELSTGGAHPNILNLVKELEENRQQTSLISSDRTSPVL